MDTDCEGTISSSQPKDSQHRSIDADLPEIRQYLSPGLTVLDIGCGPGVITLDVAQAVKPGRVIGIDPSDEMVQDAARLAQERGIENVEFRVGDSHTLDFANNTFDIVYSYTVLHFLVNPIKALSEQMRVAKKSGLVVAGGIRDVGMSIRYPTCPVWEDVIGALTAYFDARAHHFRAIGEIPPHGTYIDMRAGRKCAEWFVRAGLQLKRVEIRPHRTQYAGTPGMQQGLLDLFRVDENPTPEFYHSFFEEGYATRDKIAKAKEEVSLWYKNPFAFHFIELVLAAGRA